MEYVWRQGVMIDALSGTDGFAADDVGLSVSRDDLGVSTAAPVVSVTVPEIHP
jgi:hypothetical protein